MICTTLDSFLTEANKYKISDFEVGQVVRYKTKAYNPSIPASQQPENIQQKPISRINQSDNNLFFKDKSGNEFQKSLEDILPEEHGDLKDVVAQLKKHLAAMKNDKSKMLKVLRYVEYVESKYQ